MTPTTAPVAVSLYTTADHTDLAAQVQLVGRQHARWIGIDLARLHGPTASTNGIGHLVLEGIGKHPLAQPNQGTSRSVTAAAWLALGEHTDLIAVGPQHHTAERLDTFIEWLQQFGLTIHLLYATTPRDDYSDHADDTAARHATPRPTPITDIDDITGPPSHTTKTNPDTASSRDSFVWPTVPRVHANWFRAELRRLCPPSTIERLEHLYDDATQQLVDHIAPYRNIAAASPAINQMLRSAEHTRTRRPHRRGAPSRRPRHPLQLPHQQRPTHR